MKHLAYTALENVLNRTLALDPEFFQRISPYQNYVLQITLKGIPLNLYLKIEENRFSLLNNYAGKINTKIESTFFTLLRVLCNPDLPVTHFGKDIDINGDAIFGQDLLKVLRDFDIDWEDYLARIIGDSSAHFIGTQFATLRQFGQRTKHEFQMNLTEYLQKEKNLLPTHEELEIFYHQVDTLVNDASRCTARLERIQQRLKQKNDQTN